MTEDNLNAQIEHTGFPGHAAPGDTSKTMILNPTFNYQREIEVVKRFTEQLTKLYRENANLWTHDDNHHPLMRYFDDNLDTLREAVAEIMADDIELQIHKNTFPIRPQLFLHEYERTSETNLSCNAVGNKAHGSCNGKPDSPVHTL